MENSIIKLDELGPIILEKDGRLSRIQNWVTMTEEEREMAQRLIAKRNAQRKAALEDSKGSKHVEYIEVEEKESPRVIENTRNP